MFVAVAVVVDVVVEASVEDADVVVVSVAASSSSSWDHAGTANKAAATPQVTKVLKAFPNSFIFIIIFSLIFRVIKLN